MVLGLFLFVIKYFVYGKLSGVFKYVVGRGGRWGMGRLGVGGVRGR